MENKTGVSIKQVKLLDKQVKIDFKKLFGTLTKAAIMYAVKPFSALKEMVSISDSFKISEEPSDLAYQLILTALINSAHTIVIENRHCFEFEVIADEKIYDDENYVAFLDGISDLIAEKEHFLEYEMLKNPRTISVLTDFQPYFEKYLHFFGVSEKETELISRRLPTYFVFELNDEWRKNYTKYEKLLHHLNAPTAEAARKEREWEAYAAYLEREAEMSVFGETFSLNDIFIPLRAYHQRKEHQRHGSGKVEKTVIYLEEAMQEWLQSTAPKDTIKVIQGGPGSGKSSFAKWWAAKLAKNRTHRILFLPLHHFNIHTNIKTAIGEFLEDFEDIPLTFNPLEEPKQEKLLLIFDGLDELSMQGKSAKEAANAFMQELKNFCNLKNASKQRIKILITGRPIAVQNTEVKLRDDEQQILYLLPYFVAENKRKTYKDTHKLLEKDQRHDWWNSFYTFKELSNRNLPKELRTQNMDKITVEPLLNYLVALSWQKNPEKFDKNTNINDVYYQLMESVYYREWEEKRKHEKKEKQGRKHKGVGDIEFVDFLQILEEIAVCAWQGGDIRVTTERKIEKHIKDKDLEMVLEEYKSSTKSGVSRLLTAFYFRKYGKEDTESKDDTFEFTHKSFGEYLAARAIVELIQTTHEERTENKKKIRGRRKSRGWTIEKCLEEWLKTTKENPIDENLNTFIINEIQIRKVAGEDIEAWQKTLSEVISELVVTGMPLHKQDIRLTQIEEMKLARNAEEAILVALADCARITEKVSTIDWGEDTQNASIWFNRLSTSLQNHNFAFRNLCYLNLEKAYLPMTNLFHIDLSFADLSGANLYKVNLNDANLSFANLIHADLSFADLSFADLSHADLSHADLSHANLIGANLRKTDLTGANLTGANLIQADLTNANLRQADLNRAKFSLNQLLSTRSLYKTKGIPDNMLKEIEKRKPKLLEEPKIFI